MGGRAGDVLVDRLCAVLPDDHPLASRRSIPLAALARERFVSYSADRVPAFHQRIVGACIEAGFQPNIVQEAAHIYMIMALVAGRLGVALIPGSAAASGHRGVVRLPIAGSSRLLETRIDVVHPRSGASAAVVNVLSHCCRRSSLTSS
ncbi:LysR family substrate-binding domain-containing protein [Pigmentiphaga sp.]|uniref:LysR family substrate-binding domain-containing protein n=1 Tax=Pigmentiphaga sp. TaxID=1977564 RepID=UPI003422BFC5